MIGFSLNIIASVLTWALMPACYLFGFMFSIVKNDFSKWHLDLAIAKDVHGNVLIKHLADLLLIKKYGYKFGNPKETISYVLTQNKKKNALTILGKFIVIILNTIDKDHV